MEMERSASIPRPKRFFFEGNRSAPLICRPDGIDIDAPPAAIEPHAPVNERKNRVIAAQPNPLARMELRAALANDDVASNDRFGAEFFYAKPLRNAIATILDGTLTFLMSHWE